MTRSSVHPVQQIHALLLTQCETLRAQIGELERLSTALVEEADGRATLEAVIHTAHRIAGTGGTMGFDAISQKAFALETFAKQLLRKPDTARRDGAAVLRALTRSLASVGGNVTPEQSRLSQRLLMRG